MKGNYMKFLNLVFTTLVLAARLSGQAQSIAPNENLVVDGIPSIPAEIAAAVGRYTEFRAASLLSWHPAYHDMLISTRFGDVPQIHLVRSPGGARTQLTFFPERIVGGSYNPAHGKYFVFSKDVGGGEWYQNFRYDIATGEIAMITDGKSLVPKRPVCLVPGELLRPWPVVPGTPAPWMRQSARESRRDRSAPATASPFCRA